MLELLLFLPSVTLLVVVLCRWLGFFLFRNPRFGWQRDVVEVSCRRPLQPEFPRPLWRQWNIFQGAKTIIPRRRVAHGVGRWPELVDVLAARRRSWIWWRLEMSPFPKKRLRRLGDLERDLLRRVEQLRAHVSGCCRRRQGHCSLLPFAARVQDRGGRRGRARAPRRRRWGTRQGWFLSITSWSWKRWWLSECKSCRFPSFHNFFFDLLGQ